MFTRASSIGVNTYTYRCTCKHTISETSKIPRASIVTEFSNISSFSFGFSSNDCTKHTSCERRNNSRSWYSDCGFVGTAFFSIYRMLGCYFYRPSGWSSYFMDGFMLLLSSIWSLVVLRSFRQSHVKSCLDWCLACSCGASNVLNWKLMWNVVFFARDLKNVVGPPHFTTVQVIWECVHLYINYL